MLRRDFSSSKGTLEINTACIIGGIVHATAFYTFGMPLQQAMMLGMVITLSIRLAAIRWRLKLPTFEIEQ